MLNGARGLARLFGDLKEDIADTFDMPQSYVRSSGRKRLATVVLTLGKTCRHLDVTELQSRVLAMFEHKE